MQNVLIIIGIWGVALSFLVPFLTLVLASEGGRVAAKNAAIATKSSEAMTAFIKEILNTSFGNKRSQFWFSLPFSIVFFFVFIGINQESFMPSAENSSPERFLSFFIAFLVCNVLGDWVSVLQSTYLISHRLNVKNSHFSLTLAVTDFAVSVVVFLLMLTVSLWVTLTLSKLGVGLPASDEPFFHHLIDSVVEPLLSSQNDPVRNSFFWLSLFSTMTSTYLHLGIWGWVACLRTVQKWHQNSITDATYAASTSEELISNSVFLLLCLFFGMLIVVTIAWPGLQLLVALAFWLLNG